MRDPLDIVGQGRGSASSAGAGASPGRARVRARARCQRGCRWRATCGSCGWRSVLLPRSRPAVGIRGRTMIFASARHWYARNRLHQPSLCATNAADESPSCRCNRRCVGDEIRLLRNAVRALLRFRRKQQGVDGVALLQEVGVVLGGIDDRRAGGLRRCAAPIRTARSRRAPAYRLAPHGSRAGCARQYGAASRGGPWPVMLRQIGRYAAQCECRAPPLAVMASPPHQSLTVRMPFRFIERRAPCRCDTARYDDAVRHVCNGELFSRCSERTALGEQTPSHVCNVKRGLGRPR